MPELSFVPQRYFRGNIQQMNQIKMTAKENFLHLLNSYLKNLNSEYSFSQLSDLFAQSKNNFGLGFEC